MYNNFNEIIECIPFYKDEFNMLSDDIKNKITDIRFCIGYPPMFYYGTSRHYTRNLNPITKEMMNELFYVMCDYSVYKHEEEIKDGFITLNGKFRAGICGTAVKSDGKIINIDNITSINIRVSRNIIGVSEYILNKVDLSRGLLVIGEPCSGKTTILKDIISSLREKRIVVLDERYELTSGMKDKNFDILYEYPKNIGIEHATRNLGAHYIVCDELAERDLSAVQSASFSGINIIASVHGDLNRGLRKLIKDILKTNAFEYIVQMDNRENLGKVKYILRRSELLENFGVADSD